MLWVALFTFFTGKSLAQVCQPEFYYIVRHAERYYGMFDPTLTSEGFERSYVLLDLMMANYPVDHIISSLQHRDMLTISPLIEPVGHFSTYLEPASRSIARNALHNALDNMENCPLHVLICYPNDWIGDIFFDLGFDEQGLDEQYEDNEIYDKIYILEEETKTIRVRDFGLSHTRGSFFIISDLVYPKEYRTKDFGGDTCIPDILYVVVDSTTFHETSSKDTILTAEGFERARKLAKYFEDTNLPLSQIFANERVSTLLTTTPLETLTKVEFERFQQGDTFFELKTMIETLERENYRQYFCPSHAMVGIFGEESLDVFFETFGFVYPEEMILDGFYELNFVNGAVKRHYFEADPSRGPTIDCTYLDDQTWENLYGKCDTYSRIKENFSFCPLDQGLISGDERLAIDACCCSCEGACPTSSGSPRRQTVPPPTDCAASDDLNWRSEFGNCTSYARGHENHEFCSADIGVGEDDRTAAFACCCSCERRCDLEPVDCPTVDVCECTRQCEGWGWKRNGTSGACVKGETTSQADFIRNCTT